MVDMIKKRIFLENNYAGFWINGKTIRVPLDPNSSITELKYPEFYDVKITGYCEGECPWCYMDSKKTSKHYTAIPEKIENFFGNMTLNQRPFQVACLEENERIATDKGMICIKNINIGDSVYNENGKLIKVTNKINSQKDVIKLKGNKGFSIICTKDHLFQTIDNTLIKAEDSIGKKFKIASFKDNCNIGSIDLANYINKTSRVFNKQGGSSGGIVTKNTVAFMHTLTPIKRYLELDRDVMWFYGLIVAEGSKKSISLNKNEVHIANRANNIYKKITGLSDATYYYKNNGLTVEFKEPKTFYTIFMKAMKIGFDSSNVSINFLYNLRLDLIRSALRGMFDGDGCYRKRIDKRNNKFYYSISYKTASKKLAQELIHILYTKFGVFASYYKGINNDRYIDGRILPRTDYYMIDIYGKKNILKLFPDLFYEDVDFKKYNNNKYGNMDYIEINDIEIINDKKYVVDITLEKSSSHLFTTSHGIITHNCGGGEPTTHPQFIKILQTFKSLGIEPNYTTNGMWVNENTSFRMELLENTKKYCGGVAVSCHPHLKTNWEDAARLYWSCSIKLNFHIIISDKESIDYFKSIYDEWYDIIDYFVLLPYGLQGRAPVKVIDWEYLVQSLPENTSKIAFGAGFYSYLLQRNHPIKVSLYEPEIMSKFLDCKNMKLYSSSFHLKEIETKNENI